MIKITTKKLSGNIRDGAVRGEVNVHEQQARYYIAKSLHQKYDTGSQATFLFIIVLVI